MVLRTHMTPTLVEEQFDARDREQIHEIIAALRQSYQDRLHDATFDLHRAERSVNRAQHEISRLKRHLERIDSFIIKHDISLKEG